MLGKHGTVVILDYRVFLAGCRDADGRFPLRPAFTEQNVPRRLGCTRPRAECTDIG